jgi:hypothetical protein
VEETKTGISRRTALKGLGAGVVVAWTAPTVLSIDTPAFAGSQICTSCPGGCPRTTKCGDGFFCLPRVGASGCVCVFANFCNEAGNPAGSDVTCTSDAQCTNLGPDFYCVSTCCGGGQNLCVQATDPPPTSSTGWDVAGYYHCVSDSDCSQTNTGATFNHCVPLAGTTWNVCQ